MTSVLAPRAVVIVPEELGGLPVVELAGHLFAGSGLEEVFLPKTLKKIGRYAFYNCERLRAVHFHGGASEIGGGLFNGCGRVSDLYVRTGRDERSALRDFVTEINRRLTVHCLCAGEDGEEREYARLIFPLYYDEAVENTPARIISSSVHGSGQRYRYCFEDMRIQYDRYDRQFAYEVIAESAPPAAELAICRLMYPHALSEAGREMYTVFLEQNRMEILLENVGRPEIFKWLLNLIERGDRAEGLAASGGAVGLRRGGGPKNAGLSGPEIDLLTEAAGRARQAELLSLLMELRRRKIRPERKKFNF